jgi:hypothetical protein
MGCGASSQSGAAVVEGGKGDADGGTAQKSSVPHANGGAMIVEDVGQGDVVDGMKWVATVADGTATIVGGGGKSHLNGTPHKLPAVVEAGGNGDVYSAPPPQKSRRDSVRMSVRREAVSGESSIGQSLGCVDEQPPSKPSTRRASTVSRREAISAEAAVDAPAASSTDASGELSRGVSRRMSAASIKLGSRVVSSRRMSTSRRSAVSQYDRLDEDIVGAANPEAARSLRRRSSAASQRAAGSAVASVAGESMPASGEHSKSVDRRKSSSPTASVRGGSRHVSRRSSAHGGGAAVVAQHFKPTSVLTTIRRACADNLLFAPLSDAQREVVYGAMIDEDCEVGEVVIFQGERGDNFYVVDSGAFEARIDGISHAVAHYESGSSFGELALLYNANRAATITCTRGGRLWSIDRSVFNTILVTSDRHARAHPSRARLFARQARCAPRITLRLGWPP